MDDHPQTPAEELVRALEVGTPASARDCIDTLADTPSAERKEAIRAARTLAEDSPAAVGEVSGALAAFLRDEERSVRLTAAKLFVVLASGAPGTVTPVVPNLAGRLADDEEFYYVRARCDEALGYVALKYPGAVDDPEILAEFRIGLSFDEPEVREKLAKSLEYVALGDPSRLSHQVPSLADHLDDGNELVRYHLCTAVAAVGCEFPAKVADAADALRNRLDDESPYVRGRALEALAHLGDAASDAEVAGALDGTHQEEDVPTFLTERLAFYRYRVSGDPSGEPPDGVGTVESLRSGTDDVVEAMTGPDTDACPRCGFDRPEGGPPMCPRCGASRW